MVPLDAVGELGEPPELGGPPVLGGPPLLVGLDGVALLVGAAIGGETGAGADGIDAGPAGTGGITTDGAATGATMGAETGPIGATTGGAGIGWRDFGAIVRGRRVGRGPGGVGPGP
jgi:hypothetical protein